MSGGYQPLATYGALADIPFEEARFRPGIDHAELIHAGRFGAAFVRPAPGFQSLIYLHDGERHRVLAFWQDHAAIQRFHREGRAELIACEQAELPGSPWLTHLDEFRGGVARRQLMGPRMSLEQTDLMAPEPPAIAVIYEAAGVRDIDAVLALWQEMAPLRGLARIQQFRGFMFFSACDFGDGNISFYLGFRTPEDHAGFRASATVIALRERMAELVSAQNGALSSRDGQLLGWTVRQIS